MQKRVKKTSVVSQVDEKKMDWLEDILAGLQAAGVRMDEIEVQEHSGLRTAVLVRGELKYQFTINTAGCDVLDGNVS